MQIFMYQYAVSYTYHFFLYLTYITHIVLDLEDPNSVGELQHNARVLKVHCPEIYVHIFNIIYMPT